MGKVALLVRASIASGILGYVLAQTQAHEALDTRAAANVPGSPIFGSPLEFQKVISELEAMFVHDSGTSTDPDDHRVHVYEFSESNYYPGTFCLYFSLV